MAKENISVALYFGKKDSPLLPLLYQKVSKADFNFIIKATLKHFLKEDKFKIHIYTDLNFLINVQNEFFLEEESIQRNIVFFEEDGFLYDWVELLSKSVRATKIKQIVVNRLDECLKVVRNGGKEDIETLPQYPQIPFPFSQFNGQDLKQQMMYPYFPGFGFPPGFTQTTNPTEVSASVEIPKTDEEQPPQTLPVSGTTQNSIKKFKGSSLASMGRG